MENKKLTMGSLFDGSGGFSYAAKLANIEPLWASEIEPFPIRVTQKNLPKMEHLGNICEINGGEIPPVDIITGGSPCQDLSIAGRREGLRGERSNLFFELMRVVKEMRSATNGKYPRYFIWENVCGAFSSNKGEDFRCVLEEVGKIRQETFSVPKPTKWSKAGYILGDGFDISWRVLDSQYFGVPQRRRRIFLVADFAGYSSSKILFEQESLSGDISKSCYSWERTTGNPEISTRDTICLNDQGGKRMDVSINKTATLRAQSNHPPLVFENHGQDTRFNGPQRLAPSVLSAYGTGGNNQPFVVYDVRLTSENTRNCRHNVYECDVSRCLSTNGNIPSSNQGGVAIIEPTYTLSKNSHFTKAEVDKVAPLVATDYKDPPVVNKNLVRRITPLECCRLQGFPDYWCENLEIENPTEADLVFWEEVFNTHSIIFGKKQKTRKQITKWLQAPYTDGAAYKMWGNGVALPCVYFILSRIGSL